MIQKTIFMLYVKILKYHKTHLKSKDGQIDFNDKETVAIWRIFLFSFPSK